MRPEDRLKRESKRHKIKDGAPAVGNCAIRRSMGLAFLSVWIWGHGIRNETERKRNSVDQDLRCLTWRPRSSVRSPDIRPI